MIESTSMEEGKTGVQANVGENKAGSQTRLDNGKVNIYESQFTPITPNDDGMGSQGSINMLMDLELPVAVELGRVRMFVKDILELGPGSVVELDKFSGEPVDLFVNNKKFAEGEVVVVDQNFGVRITALVGPNERLSQLDK